MFDLFWFLRRDRPTPRQRACLRDLGVREKPRTKDEASDLIDQAVGHWEEYFSEHFPGWDSAHRVLTRPLLVYARRSRFDQIVADEQPLAANDFNDLIESAIGLECAELLKRKIDDYELGYGLQYIEAYAQAAGIRSPSPLYPYAIAGGLCRAKLFRELFETGYGFQLEDDQDAIRVLRSNNKLNAALAKLLNDRGLRKRIKKMA